MPERLRTQVGIIGGGPAGLLLGQILHVNGIRSVILERRSRSHVLGRVRAGVLEQGLANLLRFAEVGGRLDREGQVHTGFWLAHGGGIRRIDLAKLTGGKSVIVYGQTEITRDLNAARDADGGMIIHDAESVAIHEVESRRPWLTWNKGGQSCRLDCDFIAACDGFHGVGRRSFPPGRLREHSLTYPLGWLGVLARVRPVRNELIYASHARGFALCSMRSKNVSRYYVQVPSDTDLAEWPDDRFWAELRERLPLDVAAKVETGPSIEKSVAPLRSFVAEPLQCGRLFLAGDAGHIVPPTGAKGLNLAASDVHYLSTGLVNWYRQDRESMLKNYSEVALRRVWKAERFSWWFTRLTHRFPDDDSFTRRLQRAELDYLAGSRAAQICLAENYVGLPY